jgi:hypothetical protein
MKNASKTGLTLNIIGSDGNAFSILGKAIKTMKQANLSQKDIDEYEVLATSGDYNNLLRVTMDWFVVK